jgi:hypothetical protein
MKREEQQNLDKYYTKSEVASFCYSSLLETCKSLGLDNIFMVEPSAGSGAFLQHIKTDFLAFDIAPQNKDIIESDYLQLNLKQYQSLISTSNLIFIGNPPFGKRGSTALQFLNKCLNEGIAVGFIVPIQFRKWSIQNKINQNASLIKDIDLSEDSFLFMNKPYKLRCCFQIWCNQNNDAPNLRLKEKPAISHPDFEMFQYNCTPTAEKYFDYDWDFAVPRQGYLDYNKKIYNKNLCNKKQQWIFFKAKNKKVLKKLLSIDFEKLSKNNTGTPGFGKHDVISEYVKF